MLQTFWLAFSSFLDPLRFYDSLSLFSIRSQHLKANYSRFVERYLLEISCTINIDLTNMKSQFC